MDKIDEVIFKHLQNTSLDFFNWCDKRMIAKDDENNLYYCRSHDSRDWPYNFVRVSGDVLFNKYVMETFVRDKKDGEREIGT